jgi:hypothetical protein
MWTREKSIVATAGIALIVAAPVGCFGVIAEFGEDNAGQPLAELASLHLVLCLILAYRAFVRSSRFLWFVTGANLGIVACTAIASYLFRPGW